MHRTTIIGNLGDKPKTGKTDSGHSFVNFPTIVVEIWDDDEKGDLPKANSTVYWVNAWDKLAESCGEDLAEGSVVYVEGRLVGDPETGGPSIWTDKDGKPHSTFELHADRVVSLEETHEPALAAETK